MGFFRHDPLRATFQSHVRCVAARLPEKRKPTLTGLAISIRHSICARLQIPSTIGLSVAVYDPPNRQTRVVPVQRADHAAADSALAVRFSPCRFLDRCPTSNVPYRGGRLLAQPI